MEMSWFINELKLELTGGLLKLEIPDETIAQVVQSALQECQKYSDEHRFVTAPFAPTIDLTDFKSMGVVAVYRTSSFNGDSSTGISEGISGYDPVWAQQYAIFGSGGGLTYNLSNWVQNYAAYNTMLQIRNTMSTDMSFVEDPKEKKLYINCNTEKPKAVTIEYIPIWEKVEDVTEDFWIDNIKRLALAKTKIILGRIRSKYKQTSGGLMDLDGETLLSEGNEEIKALRERMLSNASNMNV